ncbi:MAG: FAD-dependent oxidoreductase [Granulosicoccaceae bacterium]
MPERNKNHDILFEPIQIGPVTCKNRFYQVPHCAGMGHQRPQTSAAMRGMKAEGGWGVVCTEYCSAHPTSDDGGYPHARLWDNNDVHAHARMTDAVHAHNALAGVELWMGGNSAGNLDTRLPTMGLRSAPINNTDTPHPVQCRAMDKRDIKRLIQWQADAARRAVTAGFDIVYVYATHGYLLSQFLDASTNQRTDEYGGSVQNRVRIVHELIDVTREAVAGHAAVATRISVDLHDEETMDAFGLLAEYPDLWDLTIPDYDIEMGASRFVKEGALIEHVAKAKSLTSKPVVAVGRFTSPDSMANVINKGKQDLIGAARPSIADPFLPNKINEGRSDDIRECIGCNVCYAHDSIGIPIRCTQNPTMGEEWRRGWHPEHINKDQSGTSALVVGAGPAGLEAARVLGERGFHVMLAEGSKVTGGRINQESKLPGLSEWARVRDWRMSQLHKLPNVEIFLDSQMDADDVIETEANHVLIATGAKWTTDGVGRHLYEPFAADSDAVVVSADTILNGGPTPVGHVLIFDDDHYYMGSALAKALVQRGNQVTVVTPEGRLFAWGKFTHEQHSTVADLLKLGVKIQTNQILHQLTGDKVTTKCLFSGEEFNYTADWVVPLTSKNPNDSLFHELSTRVKLDTPAAVIKTLQRIGDCEAPSYIAGVVHSGHRHAMETAQASIPPFKREMSSLIIDQRERSLK